MSTSSDASRPGAGLLRLLLVASVALNLFLIGLFGGLWFDDRAARAKDERGALPPALAETLTPENADALRTLRAERRSNRAEDRAEIKALRERLDAIMRAETFDKAAFLATRAEIQSMKDENRAALRGRFIDFAATLSQEERVALADAMAERRAARRAR